MWRQALAPATHCRSRQGMGPIFQVNRVQTQQHPLQVLRGANCTHVRKYKLFPIKEKDKLISYKVHDADLYNAHSCRPSGLTVEHQTAC